MKPDLPFLLAHPAHFIALGFGSGLSPRAPGTAGTLLGWALFPLISTPVSDSLFILFLAAFFGAGVIVCDRAGRALGESDHGSIVWDEIVAIWLVLFFTPEGLAWQAFAVVAFRFFDILKPPPIRWADKQLKGGFGVMFDDILAAGYAIGVVLLVHHYLIHPTL